MVTVSYLTTTQVARRLGMTRQGILMRISRGTMAPALTLDNGNYLFDADEIEPAA